MERDKYFSSLLYSICEGLNCFFFSETQKKICPIERKKPYLPPLLKNGHSRMTLELKPRMGKVLSALCKYCSEVEYNDCMREGLTSICFFFFSRKCYIHSSKYICPSCRSATCQNMQFVQNLNSYIVLISRLKCSPTPSLS